MLFINLFLCNLLLLLALSNAPSLRSLGAFHPLSSIALWELCCDQPWQPEAQSQWPTQRGSSALEDIFRNSLLVVGMMQGILIAPHKHTSYILVFSLNIIFQRFLTH